jgi:hypothetical protein
MAGGGWGEGGGGRLNTNHGGSGAQSAFFLKAQPFLNVLSVEEKKMLTISKTYWHYFEKQTNTDFNSFAMLLFVTSYLKNRLKLGAD